MQTNVWATLAQIVTGLMLLTGVVVWALAGGALVADMFMHFRRRLDSASSVGREHPTVTKVKAQEDSVGAQDVSDRITIVKDPLTKDDVLDIHKLLKTCDNLEDLIGASTVDLTSV